jgi:valyl-tRNA synthetase
MKGERSYKAGAIEAKWRQYWEDHRIYAWNPDDGREQSFVIDTPPPTVSGLLHIGHVYSYTQTDILARYQRMSGRNVFYSIGFDDNGLPTERLVEKVRNIRANEMSREDFINICHEVVRDVERDFRNLFRRIALSFDWALEYQTIGALSRTISQLSILHLFAKGALHRRLEPTLWDTADRTALAQAEVVDREQTGTLWQVAFDCQGAGDIIIATTRPELLGACVALLIHPSHPEAARLIGTQAVSPLFTVPVPILGDERVDREKGTGVVMCCTFGDTTDIEWWRGYNLPTRVIIEPSGRIGRFEGLGSRDWPCLDRDRARAVASELEGLTIKAARRQMAERLAAVGRIRGETAIVHSVPCGERSGLPLEILVAPQWFVRTLDKKEALIARGREIVWYPEFMRARFENWTENLKWDWCISRQRYFGVPLPFWYSKRPGEEGRVVPAHPDDLPVDPLTTAPRGYSREEVVPDPDVMDTWATSSVSPQINSWAIAPGFGIDFARHAKLFPADLRPQSHEIIRTWAFYTILKAQLHENTVPWRKIAISGWCLAEDHSKMSKSQGNVVVPDTLLDQVGSDVVRYWTGTSKLGLDTTLSENVLKIGKRLVTKLWNAAHFVDIHLNELSGSPKTPWLDIEEDIIRAPLDRWILGRLGQTVDAATNAFDSFEYSDALYTTERFFWHDFCDNYLEFVKGRAYGDIEDASARQSALYTLWHCLETQLRLFAPFIPYVTEELYSALFPGRFKILRSVHARGNWPKRGEQVIDTQAIATGELAVSILATIRRFKTAHKLSMKAPVRMLCVVPGTAAEPEDASRLESVRADLQSSGVVREIKWLNIDAGVDDTVESADDRFRLHIRLDDPQDHKEVCLPQTKNG